MDGVVETREPEASRGKMGNRKALGKRVRTMREARTWTQDDVAQMADVSPKSVSNLERGNTVRPKTTVAVLAVFGDDGVQALQELGFPDWAQAVAEQVEDGFDQRLQALMRQFIRSDPDRIRRWLDENNT